MNKTLEEMAVVLSGRDYKGNPPGDKVPIYGTGGIMGYTSIPLYQGKSILSGRKGSINNPFYVEGDFWNVDTIFCIKTKEGIDTKWLYYNFLNTDLTRINEARGVPSVSSKALYKLKFNWLELPEQRRIAQILSTTDAVIEQTQAAIAKYKAIKQGMLHDLFTRGIDITTGKLRPKQEDTPDLYKESKLGWVPKEWDVKEIDKIGDIVTGSTPPTANAEYYGNEFLFVSPADIHGELFISDTEKKLTQSGFDLCRKLPVNTICIVCIGSTIGKIAILRTIGCTNQQINSVVCFDSDLSFFYFYAMLCYNEQQFGKEVGLQAVPIVNKNNFSKFILPLVEKNEALEISKRLLTIDHKLQTEQNYLQKLQALKQGLMGDLLSGKVKVSETLIGAD